MQQIKRKISNQYTQPSLPFNAKAPQIALSPRQRHLNRSISNQLSRFLNYPGSKSFKKSSTQTSAKQKQIQKKFKYINSSKEGFFQRSMVHSLNNLGPLFIQGQFQDISASINQSKFQSRFKKEDKQQKVTKKANSAHPFDVESGLVQQSTRHKNDDYYIYWKGKAHEYLESNMKLMDDIRKLTHENSELKQRIQQYQSKAASIQKEVNSQYLKNQSIKRQQNKANAYLVEKIEELQTELKKKDIVVKFYQQKIMDLNSRIVSDNQRSKLIAKLKSQIDDLKARLSKQLPTTSNYLPTEENLMEGKIRNVMGSGYFRGSSFDRR